MMVQCVAGLGGLVLTVMAAACGPGDPASPGPGLPPSTLAVRLRQVASGLASPVFLTSPPGDQERTFVVEQGGRIRIIRNDALVSAPFLDISSRIQNGGEQGLLGLAFHPGYAANGRLVVYYTNTSGDIRIASYRVTANPDVADPASEQILLAVPHPSNSNHNGGMVAFGPDGRLYTGIGDGGGGGDPSGNGQNRNVLLGKMVRLDVSAGGQASVPPGNPFFGQAGMRPEIWSYGLRNPWRFSFDRVAGDLYIGDVGQDLTEEIDFLPRATARRIRTSSSGRCCASMSTAQLRMRFREATRSRAMGRDVPRSGRSACAIRGDSASTASRATCTSATSART